MLTSSPTLLSHLCVWGSLLVFILFNLIYCGVPSAFGETETTAGIYWVCAGWQTCFNCVASRRVAFRKLFIQPYRPLQVFFMLWRSSGFWMCAGLTLVVAVFPNYLLG